MKNNNSNHGLTNGKFAFFRQFLKHPLQVGSVIPSSPFLERRILEVAEIDSRKTIVELGAGDGGTTRAILRAMPSNGRLLSIEINPHLYKLLESVHDNRLIPHLGDACDLKEIVAHYGLPDPEVIISGIPFSNMSRRSGTQVIEAISSLLAPHGCFVAYQVRKRVTSLCRPVLGEEESELEFLNIPPMRVYRWEKSAA